MTFIVGKKQDGKTYYYLAESARVEGKPRIVSQRYLGSAEEIAARLSEAGPGEPDRSRHLAFGDVAAVWGLLGRLRVAEIVDEVAGARRSDAGASVGTYIALATLNRVVDPCSKLAFSEWWDKTACDRWLRLPPGALDHRRFWEAMDAIGEDDIQEIERRIVSAMVNELVARFGALLPDGQDRKSDRLTLVYDAGQNSDDNYELLDGAPLSFVGSLPPSDHPGLLAVPKDRYQVVDQEAFPGLVAFETAKAVFGKERRLVVCHSDGLHAKQSRGFDQTLAKAHRQLAEVSARLARGRTRNAREKVEAEIAAILAPRWVARVIKTTLTGNDPAELRLSFGTGEEARAALEEELFGKRILFSDKTTEQAATSTIVAEYRSQESVEGDFRQIKDPKVVSFSPMFHFTESKIRVHVLYCVLALMAARLMVREAGRAGLHLSVRALLSSLAGIQETVLLYQGERGRPRARRMLTEKDATQNRLYDIFGLDAYAPRR